MQVKHIHEEPTGKLAKALVFPVAFIVVMWAVFLLEQWGSFSWYTFGIYPREAEGLLGIITTPFLHGDLNHLINNSLPILLLGTGIFYFYREVAWKIALYSLLITGIWVWVGARPSYHIGASGVVYAWAFFVFSSGVIRKNKHLMTLSLIVVFLYGSMVWGILPVEDNISWESHLYGAIAGLLLAYFFRKEGPQRKVKPWEEEDDLDEENPYWLVDEEQQVNPEARPMNVRYIYKAKKKSDN